MLRNIIAVSLALAAPAAAEGLVADAFGLVPEAVLSDDRARWSGVRLRNGKHESVAPRATEEVAIFVGPKNLVAGKDRGHAVALATDWHGNLAADGDVADFVLGANQNAAKTRNGIANVLFRPTTLAGTYVAGATIDARQSPRATFRVTADLASLGPVRTNLPDVAITETMSPLITEPLTDRFGNAAENGTAATITLAGPDGSANYVVAHVRDGRARANFLLRDTGVRLVVSTTVASHTASGGELILEDLTYAGPVEATLWPISELAALALRIEPVETSAGHLLNDGTAIEIALTGSDGVRHIAGGWLLDGVFQTVIPTDPANGPFTLRAITTLGAVDVALRDRAASGRIAGSQ